MMAFRDSFIFSAPLPYFHSFILSFFHFSSYLCKEKRTEIMLEELKQRILNEGHASGSVIHLCRMSGAQIVGMGFLVEKGFAGGGQFLRDHNIPYHALATIKRIRPEDNAIELA